MRPGRLGQDHAGRQHTVGIAERLEASHQGDRIRTPLRRDERRHVPPGAVLRLERAVVPMHHQVDHVVEESAVAVDRGGVGHRLGHEEMEIAVLGVAEDHRIVVSVAAEEPLQIHRPFGETIDREGHVFEEERGPGGAPAADGGIEPLPRVQEAGLLRRVASERAGGEEREPPGRVARRAFALGQCHVARSLDLHQQRRGPRGYGVQPHRHPREAGDGLERGLVEQLDHLRPPVAEGRDRRAGGVDRREEQERGGGVVEAGDGAEHRLADERERSLRPDQRVGEDVDRAFEVEEGVEPVAGGVLGEELPGDPLFQGPVREELLPEREEPAVDRGGALAQLVVGVVVGGVDPHAARQDERERCQGVIRVLRHAGAGAARIVGEDPAQGAGRQAGRIGAEAGAVGGEEGVEVIADHPRAGPDPPSVIFDRGAAPVAGDLDHDPVGDRLSGKTRPRCTEDDGDVMVPRDRHHRRDLALIPDQHHRPRHQVIHRRVAGEGGALDVAVEDAVGCGRPAQGLDERVGHALLRRAA